MLQYDVLHKCGHAMVAAKRGDPTSSPPLCSSQLELDFTGIQTVFYFILGAFGFFCLSFWQCHQLIH